MITVVKDGRKKIEKWVKIFVGRTENFTVCSYNNEDSSTQFLLNFDEWNESYDILSCTDLGEDLTLFEKK